MVVLSKHSSSRFLLGIVPLLVLIIVQRLGEQRTIAQIIPDATLGTESSQVTRMGNSRERVTGGAIRGNTLFHSFADFNIREGASAYFQPSGAIANIFSRVTGDNPSDILGTLGVRGNANLFLLNPNGIVFGPNARLDIGGSFVASTGDRVTFPDGSFFSATEPNGAPPLLTMNLTPGLQLGTGQAPISNQGQLIAGGDLRLNGSELILGGSLGAWGDLELVGGDRVQIRDTALEPFVSQAGGNLTIEGGAIDIFALNHPHSGLVSSGDMVLRSSIPPSSASPTSPTSPAIIGDAHYWSGGDFRIETTDGSLAAMTSPNDPVIRATGDVELESYTGASLHILAGGSVNIPGQIQITGPDTINGVVETVQLSDGSIVEINGQTEPTLDIRAGVDPSIFSDAREPIILGFRPDFTITGDLATTDTPATADIKIGPVKFETFIFGSPLSGTALITNQYEPNPALTGDIQLEGIVSLGGNVVVDAQDNLRLMEGGTIETTPFPVSIPSRTLNNIGSILLIAAEELTLEDGFIIGNRAAGNTTFSGGITIRAGSLQMGEGSQISATSFASQDGGNINIFVQDSITLIGDPEEELTESNERINTGIISTVNPNEPALNNFVPPSDAANSGGNIRIEGGSLLMTDGATIGTLVSPGQNGNAGNIDIDIDGDIRINGQGLSINRPGAVTGIDTRLGEAAKGRGGNITIQSRTLTLNSAGFPSIRTDSLGEGDAGNIRVDLAEKLTLRNGSAIITDLREEAEGSAGNMIVNANRVILQDGALISTVTSGDGDGGRLSINSKRLLVQGGSSISSQTFGPGRAGDIVIQPFNDGPDLDIDVLGEESQITGSTLASGNSGNLTISARESITIQGDGRIAVETFASGEGGELEIQTGNLSIQDGVVVSTRSNRRPKATGNGGEIEIDVDVLTMQDGVITARSFGNSSAGDITVRARDVDLSNRARISAETENGVGGDVVLQDLNTLDLENSTISAQTATGRAGSLDIVASDQISLNNRSRLSVEAESERPSSDGVDSNASQREKSPNLRNPVSRANASPNLLSRVAGTLILSTDTLQVFDGSTIQVSSPDGQAGNVLIDANTILLSNGAISAETGRSTEIGEDSANVTINGIDLLAFQDGSLISAQANAAANGGNITLNANNGFIVAGLNGNNDIIATAIEGNGGSIDITAQRLFGLQENSGNFDPLRANQTNDMSVTSTLGTSGVISVDDLGLDPVQAVADLPAETAPPLLSQGCTPGGGQGRFTNAGQGGIPLGAGDVRGSDRAWEDIYPPDATTAQSITTAQIITEAQQWTLNAQGQIVLESVPRHKDRLFTCQS